jgi:hypothetical protein
VLGDEEADDAEAGQRAPDIVDHRRRVVPLADVPEVGARREGAAHRVREEHLIVGELEVHVPPPGT